MKNYFLGAMIFIALFFNSCTKNKPKTVEEPSPPQTAEAQAKRGKAVYMSRCTACHNSDPSKRGALGPEVANAKLEVLRLKIVEGKYPEGYTPKRPTKLMVPMPDLKNEIESLHSYLNQ